MNSFQTVQGPGHTINTEDCVFHKSLNEGAEGGEKLNADSSLYVYCQVLTCRHPNQL